MEAIRNYLESMFANLPNTPDVIKAKDELWQMMEDNYEELIAQGKSENEAVGTVISEFGNIDDLELNLEKEYQEVGLKAPTEPIVRRIIGRAEAEQYLNINASSALMIALGVFLCITSVIGCILFDSIGVLMLMLFVVGAVALFIVGGQRKGQAEEILREPGTLDYETTNHISAEYKKYKNIHSIRMTLGILCCAFSWMPLVVVDVLSKGKSDFLENLMVVVLMLCVGFGVFFIILTSMIKGGYEALLKNNDSKTVSGDYRNEEKEKVEYISKGAQTVMTVFWPTVVCIYLAVSFLSFAWGITWMIWPMAVVINLVLNLLLVKRD